MIQRYASVIFSSCFQLLNLLLLSGLCYRRGDPVLHCWDTCPRSVHFLCFLKARRPVRYAETLLNGQLLIMYPGLLRSCVSHACLLSLVSTLT
jgi:hypothetical protein